MHPRGSEWRKWDLHVHTPESIVQDYGGDTPENWEAFIRALASLPAEVKVIGITDYLFLDGYEYLLTRRDEIPNIELFLPNIEFRLNTFSGTASNTKRHNFHVLFDPSVSVADIREQLLSGLSTGYKIEDGSEWQQTPTPRSLEQLGRQMKAAAPAGNTIHHKTNLAAGFDSITYKRDDIEHLLRKTCFRGRVVTAIGYSEWDQSRWDQSAAEKRTLINTAEFSLTSLDDPAKLSLNRQDLVDNKLNSLVLHSSDAHQLSRIGATMLWVKADPTFAGLKQVLNEPEVRVFLGAMPPNYKPDHQVISSITVRSSNGWFDHELRIDLNRDLVTIIGGRGSGKSALAEAIAYGAGSRDSSPDAFLAKAARHKHAITGTTISLEWEDGNTTEWDVGTLDEDKGLVRYLPQGAVEELCSPEHSDKLQEQIEHVIFQALDVTARLGASDFSELKTRILTECQYEKEQTLRSLRSMNRKLSELALVLRNLPQREQLLDDKKKELDRLNKSLPELPAEDKRGQEELTLLLETKQLFDAAIVDYEGRQAMMSQLETKVRVFKITIKEYGDELAPLLAELSITDTAAFEVRLDESRIRAILAEAKSGVTTVLHTLKEGEKGAVAKLLGLEAASLPCANLDDLTKSIGAKERDTRAFETTKLKYQQQKKTVRSVELSIQALTKEIEKTKTEAEPEKKRLEAARIAAYSSYFALLQEEKRKIEQLYKPLQDTLLDGTETDKRLVFEAQVRYRHDQHCRAGLEIIDRTRRGNFREATSLGVSLTRFWEECVRRDFTPATLERELASIMRAFTVCDDVDILIEDQLRESHTLEDFYNWLFDPTLFGVVSTLTFDDTDLEVLSPGQKGIILLMLYLEIDKGDYRPLIIDQPEENLDNLSVYKDVIQYFRDRKQYRQIIMVTHNPNLVINTDAEQVIVADYNGKRTPRLQYRAGSLEDKASQDASESSDDVEKRIIEQACNILEGGESALYKRQRKYQLAGHG